MQGADNRLGVFAAIAILALVGLFSCAHFSIPEECRQPTSVEVKDRCDKLVRDQMPEHRPIYMNGR